MTSNPTIDRTIFNPAALERLTSTDEAVEATDPVTAVCVQIRLNAHDERATLTFFDGPLPYSSIVTTTCHVAQANHAAARTADAIIADIAGQRDCDAGCAFRGDASARSPISRTHLDREFRQDFIRIHAKAQGRGRAQPSSDARRELHADIEAAERRFTRRKPQP